MSTATKRRKSQRRPAAKRTPRPQSVQQRPPAPLPPAPEKPLPAVVWKITTPLPGLHKIRKSRCKSWQPTVLVAESSSGEPLHLISSRNKRQAPRVTLCLQSSLAASDTGIKQINSIIDTIKLLPGLRDAIVVVNSHQQDWIVAVNGWEQDVLDSAASLLSLDIQDAGEDCARNWIAGQATKREFARGAIYVEERWIGGVAAVLDDEASLYEAIPRVIHRIDAPVILHLENGSLSTLVAASGVDRDELSLEIAKLRLRLAGEQIHSVRVSDHHLLVVIAGSVS